MPAVTESDLELAALEWFADLQYEVLPSDNLDPESVYQERSSLEDVILQGRLSAAIRRLNPELSEDSVHEVLRKLMRRDQPTLALQNEAFHRLVTGGVTIEVAVKGGGVRGKIVHIVDYERPENNDWVVSNQLTVIDRVHGRGQVRRPDLVVWLNGLPIAVLELKNPADENADIEKAIRQLETYKGDIPSLFVSNALLVVSDDVHAKLGSLTADRSRYGFWRTIKGEKDEPRDTQPLEVLLRGVFDKARLLDLIRGFITFEHDRGEVQKKVAGYHQFHAVRRAVEETVRASSAQGDKRVGVVWHTQGSGKSLSMLFYAGKLIADPRMENPTLVVLTDRNDLDEQLFGTFSKSEAILRQTPVKAADRKHLKELLRTASGGVYFTTIQKFLGDEGENPPPLSERRNIVVMADEAHRSQYGLKSKLNTKTGELVQGLAQQMHNALKNASFIGFTGTPIDLKDRSTVRIFGDTISQYDIQRAVEDKATVPIYYENRLARLELDEAERPHLDDDFEEVTEGEEEERKEALKSEWSTLEALVGTEKRLGLVAQDLVEHFEQRLASINGKALVVCMSRRIAAELYNAIAKLRPDWAREDDDTGSMKVVMTGSASDIPLLRPHVRSKSRRERLAERFKDPKDPLKLVIVRDMWLTGFDAPCLHTLYVDKPMQGHNLMQAIARVNRVYGDKPAGLVVDYLGIASFLKEALHTYTESGGRGKTTEDHDRIVEEMFEQLEICRDVLHGFDIPAFLSAPPTKRLQLLPVARELVLSQQGKSETVNTAPKKSKSPAPKPPLDGHDRYMQAVGKLSAAFAGASGDSRCEEIRNEVAFHQAVRAGLVKLETGKSTSGADLSHAIRQIVANAVVPTDVMDVFAVAGLPKPDISILSKEFLAEVQGMKHKNLAAALLKRLLQDEVRTRQQSNVVVGRKFSEMLEAALNRFRTRAVSTVQVIEELIELAHAMSAGDAAEKKRNLSREESAFFDALAENKSAVDVLKDEGLTLIARELTLVVAKNTSIDWNQKKSVQARLRIALKKVLKAHGYPPDASERAIQLVLAQAETLRINLSEGTSEAAPKGAEEGEAEPKEKNALPSPIAFFDGLVSSQANPVLRVKTRRDGFDKVLVFLAGIGLALLRERAGGTVPEKARKEIAQFAGRPISMGGWFELACNFAAEIPPDPSDPLVTSVRALVTPDGKRSELAQAIAEHVIPDRNVFAHTVTATEEAVAAAEEELMTLWSTLERALDGLRTARLVARVTTMKADLNAKTIQYQVRELHGNPAHFPIREETLRDNLEGEWAYALRGSHALCLAPVVACVANEDGSGHGVFLARELGVAPGKAIETVSLSGSAKKKIPPPA
jgi:type I restriction enzyme R subunit